MDRYDLATWLHTMRNLLWQSDNPLVCVLHNLTMHKLIDLSAKTSTAIQPLTALHLTEIWLTAVIDAVVAVTTGWLPRDANVDDS